MKEVQKNGTSYENLDDIFYNLFEKIIVSRYQRKTELIDD